MDDERELLKPREGESILSDTLSARDQRSLIFHLLYAVDSFDYDTSLEAVVDNFARGFGIIVPRDSNLYKEVADIIQERDELDKLFQPLLDNWRYERLGTTTRLILRIALWEFTHTHTDPVIIINEAVELAKCFAEKDAYRFVNGILDEFIKRKQTP
jgi:transcription antitermination protein NusB